MKRFLSIFLIVCFTLSVIAQDFSSFGAKRTPVLITNDLSGDVDGLYALAHQLLCSGSDVKGIVGTHLGGQQAWSKTNTSVVGQAVINAHDVINLLNIKDDIKVVAGADKGLEAADKPIESEGAKLIIEEAHKASPEKPLYVTVGASLTDVASAWLMDHSISKNIVVVWIGGQEYPFGHPFPPQYKEQTQVEYNLKLDIKAAQTVFNLSDLKVLQIPRDVYRQCLYSYDEIVDKIAPCGEIGKYLNDKMLRFGNDAYVLGDSPMVLISTLTTTFEPGAASSFYEVTKAPKITDEGLYDFSNPGREIIVYKTVDTRLMFSDMEAKLRNFSKKK